MKDSFELKPSECVAVIGMACRFPGARNAAQFWRNLREGVESIRFFSRRELLEDGVPERDLEAPNYVRAKGVLEDAELFDADFFGLTPREAEAMDPQHRLALECAWEALEDAGCDPSRYRERIGVYMGQGTNSYLLNNLMANPRFLGSVGDMQISLQNRNDHLTTRISYKLDLRGPSLNVQTACSTSLVAIHLACQSLLNFQCEMALAGGVSVHVPLRAGYFYNQAGILSPDGHCRAFDARAQGTLAGDGAGVVVLKRLEDALAEGDCVRAVILGSSVNNDGAQKMGFTAPGVEGQSEVIAEALEVAGAEPESISYVEAHATGTPLGDPIEVEALDRVFKSATHKKGFCALGAVKSNLGHLDAAAGVAGFIKAVLALQHREIPPTLHFSEPNPRIRFAESAFYPAERLIPWQSPGRPRRAGVSSFGFGGTNAHAVLQEAPPQEKPSEGRLWKLLPISARTRPALEEATRRLARHLEEHPQKDLADAAYTLQTGRKEFGRRRVLVCRSRQEAVQALKTMQHPGLVTAAAESRERSVAFLFPGQGAQFAGMARELYRTETEFRRQADRCGQLLQPHLGFDVRELLFSAAAEADGERIGRTDAAQPALFLVEYSLARLWIDWGIRPQAMLGHSIGEWVAACLAGVFSLEDALKLVALRGQWMQKMPAGAMLAVPLGKDRLEGRLTGGLAVAAVNRPSLCVVSGPQAPLGKLQEALAGEGVICRPLHTSHAFHSPMMDPLVAPFERQVAQVERHAPQIPFLSNTSGGWITPSEARDPGYWAHHIRKPVLFSNALMQLFEDPSAILLEVGPGRTLTSIIRGHPFRAPAQQAVASLSHPRERRPESADILQALGKLWLAGASVDWQSFSRQERRQRVPLPVYPFERRRYWVAPDFSSPPAKLSQAGRADPGQWLYVPCWTQLPPLPLQTQQVKEEGCVLLFKDSCGLGEILAARLQSRCRCLVKVTEGEDFRELAQDSFSIRKGHPQDCQALLQALQETGRLPSRIVHLWGVTPCRSRPENLENCCQRGFWSLLYLAQAWGRLGIETEARILAVTSNAHRLTGNEALYPEKASVLGPVRVIPHEYPRLSCCCADVEAPAENRWDSRLADALVRELDAPPQHSLIACRGGSRWVQTFQPLPLNGRSGPVPRLRRRGVYLITGGLSGIGLEIAAWMARTCQARLALLARSPFPQDSRSRLQALQGRGPHDPLCRRIRRVQQMEEAGAEVLVLSADVADPEGLGTAVRRIKERFGAIHGAIHCAGMPGSGLIHLKQPSQAAQVLAPKVEGTLNLDEALREEGLDFFILFSSLNAFWGTYGQADYTAANAFLDAFAQSGRGRCSGRILSINWNAWQGVGMRARMNQSPPENGAFKPDGPASGGHPLLERLEEDSPRRQAYATRFQVDKHWVLDEHRALGRGMLPGVAFLEMARAALQKHARGPIELREVYFLHPVSAGDDEAVDVRLLLDKAGQGFSFSIWCAAAAQSASQAWVKCAEGKALCHPPQPQPTHDLRALIRSLGASREVDDDPRRNDENIGPRWHNQKKAYLGRNQLVGEFELSRELAGDLEDYHLHPGLLDRIVGSCLGPFYGRKGTVYLPWSYQRVLIRGRFPRRVFCHARFRADDPKRDEMPSNDILVLDEEGRELVDIQGFSQRKTEGLAARAQVAASPDSRPNAHQAALPADGASPGGLEISIEEGIEAFARILSSVAAPQLAVCPQDPALLAERLSSRQAHSAVAQLLRAKPEGPSHPRPELAAPFEAPQDEAQKALASIWEEILGVGPVGIHDNFFELGGDSVQVIQVVSKSSQAGSPLSPQLIFEKPTIAQLAAARESTTAAQPLEQASQPEQGAKTSDFPMAGLDEERLAKLIEGIETPELP